MPSKRRLSPKLVAALFDELQHAPHGEKRARIEAAAALYGVSPSTLYRKLGEAGFGSEQRRTPRTLDRPEYHAWAGAVMSLALKSPDGRAVPLVLALDAAVRAGVVPPEAARMPLGTLQRIAREAGYREERQRVNWLAAEYAHQVVVFDGSHSQYFSVVKQLDDGDYLLRLDNRPRTQREYKNKPVNKDRQRVIVYAAWEMYSGAQWARYTVGRGENAADGIQFLCDYMLPHPDPADPIRGVMEQLWVDNGPIAKYKPVRDLLGRLGIDVVPGPPYAKERQGGVEQTHRRRWEFERAFFVARISGGEAGTLAAGELRLSELNGWLQSHLARLNARPSRRDPGLNKYASWQRSIAARGGVRALPDNPIETLATEAPRYVGQNGLFVWDNVWYEVETIFCRHVYARRSLGDPSKVIVEDIETGQRYAAWKAEPRLLGDYRAFPDTPAQSARKAGEHMAGAIPFDAVADSKVVAFPQRTQPAAALADPLDAGRYSTLSEALRAFAEIHGMPSFAFDHPEQFAEIIEIIQSARLDKDLVRTLALELRDALRVGEI